MLTCLLVGLRDSHFNTHDWKYLFLLLSRFRILYLNANCSWNTKYVFLWFYINFVYFQTGDFNFYFQLHLCAAFYFRAQQQISSLKIGLSYICWIVVELVSLTKTQSCHGHLYQLRMNYRNILYIKLWPKNQRAQHLLIYAKW